MSLLAAAGMVDLEATPGLWLTGFGDRERPSDAKLDPIQARALVLSDGSRAVALVSMDLVGLDAESGATIRGYAPGVATLVSSTHTHSGPASMSLRGVMGFVDRSWLARALSLTGTLVEELTTRLTPAELAYGEALVTAFGYNRQAGGEMLDETLRVIGVRDTRGAPIATIGSYACHPVVLGHRNFALSADFPGAFARAVDARAGLGIFLQGCAGDVDPALNRDQGWGSGTYAAVQVLGGRLAASSEDALQGARWTAEVPISARARVVDVPLAQTPAVEDRAAFEAEHREALEAAMRSPDRRSPGLETPRAACVPLAMLEWLQDYRTLEREGRLPGAVAAEVWSSQIGEVAIAGVPFEAYTEVGVALRTALGVPKALVLGYANGLIGYLASDAAMDRGGYGPGSSHLWFRRLPKPLARGAQRVLVEAVRALVA